MTAGLIAVRTGRLEDAARILAETRPGLARIRDSQFCGPIYRSLVELAIATDDLAAVPALVDEAVDLMSETDDLRQRSSLLALAVQAAAAEARANAARGRRARSGDGPDVAGVDSRLDQLRALIGTHRYVAPRELAHAEANLSEAEAERLVLIGRPAAEVWSAAATRWLELGEAYAAGWCLTCLAEAQLTSGARAEGEAALREAHGMAVALGAVPLRSRVERLAALARVVLEAPADVPEADRSDPPVTVATRSSAAGPVAARASRPFELTERETQVLPLLAAGYTDRQIAEALFISESTAGVHVSRIIDKMGVANRVEAAALAVRSGLAG
jgi:DNA-binding CsgD family transcriptional regulator